MNLDRPSAVAIRRAAALMMVITARLRTLRRRLCSFVTATAVLCVLWPVAQGNEGDTVLVKAGYVQADRSFAVYLEFVIDRTGGEISIKDIRHIGYFRSSTDGSIDVKRSSQCNNDERMVEKYLNSPYGRGADKRGITGEIPIAVSCDKSIGYLALKLRDDSTLIDLCAKEEGIERAAPIVGTRATVMITFGHQAMCLEDLSGVDDPEAAIRKILEK